MLTLVKLGSKHLHSAPVSQSIIERARKGLVKDSLGLLGLNVEIQLWSSVSIINSNFPTIYQYSFIPTSSVCALSMTRCSVE